MHSFEKMEVAATDREYVKEGGCTNFKESKQPGGLYNDIDVIYEKELDMGLGKDYACTSIWWWWCWMRYNIEQIKEKKGVFLLS